MTIINKEKFNSQLAAARFVIAQSGKNPRQIGRESRLKILKWIYRWGYTSSSIGQLLLNRTSGGYMQKLAKQNWLVATKTKSGVPSSFFTLSQIGLEEAERHSLTLSKYLEIDQFKVEQTKIRHYLIAQESTIRALESGVIVDYKTERMFFNQGDTLGSKRPDIIWVTGSGTRIAVEVELSAKWERVLDDFVLKIIRALKTNSDSKSEFNRFIIISDSAAIIRRYEEAVQPDAEVSAWVKNSRGHWVIEKTYRIPDWLITKVDFQLIES
jgi:hypothetical protein